MDVGERVGEMNREWLNEKLEDFGCTVDDDCAAADEILQRLNALATTTQMVNDDVVDGLIAHLLNLKRTFVGADVVEEFAKQEASKTTTTKASSRQSTAAGGSEAAASAYNALQRSILRELPLQSNTASATAGEDDDDPDVGFDFGCGGGEDFVGMELPPQRDKNRGSEKFTASAVKSAYRGRLFAAGSQNISRPAGAVARLRILSECNPTAYGYGNANVMFDLNEMFDDELVLDEKAAENKVNDENSAPTAATASTLAGMAWPADGGRRLTTNNVLLRTTASSVPLNTDRFERLALFPGRRLKLIGRLIDGVFHAERALDASRLPPSPLDRTTDFEQLKICVASGLFAFTDGGDAFANLLKHCANSHAHALILIGPFAAKDGASATAVAPGDIFVSYMRTLSQFLATRAPRMRVLVVPCAAQDLCAMPYFPTPPYAAPQATAGSDEWHPNITLLPDPAVFELEGVRFAVTSSEVVLHLSRSEIYKSADAENEDRMRRLISHLFSSHSLYPLCPGDASLPLSLKNLRAHTTLSERPHVLVLPSVLQPGVKIVDRCLALNPGRAMRGKSAGTFATLTVDLKSAVSSLEDSVEEFSTVSLLSSVLSA